MATPPTFVQEAETAFNNATSPKTTAAFDVVVDDVLVAFAVAEDGDGGTYNLNISNTGTALVWTQRQEVVLTAYTYVSLWTAPVTVSENITVSFTRSAGSNSIWFGGNVLTWRDSDGVGASNKANSDTGDSSVTVANTGDNSALVGVVGDWNAVDGASRTWRTINSVTPAAGSGEVSYFRDSSHYTLYGAYWSDCGASGNKVAGLTDPNGMKWSIAAVEVLGTTAAGASAKPLAAFVSRTRAGGIPVGTAMCRQKKMLDYLLRRPPEKGKRRRKKYVDVGVG